MNRGMNEERQRQQVHIARQLMIKAIGETAKLHVLLQDLKDALDECLEDEDPTEEK